MDRPFSAYTGDEPYVFVSYSHSDSSAVYPELVWLKESGFNVWYDEGIEAGTEWREELAKAIKSANLLVYFVTRDSVQSENCRKEVNFAVDEGIPIVAIHVEAVELPSGLKLTLSDRQAILKYEISKDEYQHKLQTRISSYLELEIVQPVQKQAKKTVPALAVVGGVLVLAVGFFVYNQQDVQPITDAPTDQTKEETTPEQPTSNESEQVDLAAMHSIAVLPFANMSTNEEIGFFADGLSEDILDDLTQTKRVKVASRSASFQFAERGVDPSLVGEKLNVAYLLEGSVRQKGEELRITAQLIRTGDSFHVWSKTYERILADGFDMQTAVASNIAHVAVAKLRIDILRNYGREHMPQYAGVDPVAMEHYLNGQEEIANIFIGEGGDYGAAVQFLENAVAVDPDFAYPYPLIAWGYLTRHALQGFSLDKSRTGAYNAISRAIALNPDTYELNYQRTRIYLLLDLDYARVEQESRQYLIQNPKTFVYSMNLSDIALREGRTRAALTLIANLTELAESLSASGQIFSIIALHRWTVGDNEAALRASTRALKLILIGPDRRLVLVLHSLILVMLDRIEEAIPYIDQGWELDRNFNPERYIYLFAKTGEVEKAKSILIDQHYIPTNHFFLAMGYLALGDINNTFNEIEAGIENHDSLLVQTLLVADEWDPIRDDPRFGEMLELLDSKVTHTEQYLSERKLAQGVQ